MTPFLALLLALADPGPAIDAFAQKAMKEVGTTPALTIVVVKDDRVVHRADYGLRDVEAKLPVTSDTRFYIASSTKAFTAMTALVLAEEGKVDLDAPITDVWKEVKFGPSINASRLSLRDFLAMRPGLNNSTFNFRSAALGNLADEAEKVRVLATYSEDRPRTFEYSNMSYALAAEILERATGRTWQDLTAEKVFTPLGMTSTTSHVPPANTIANLYRATSRGTFVRNVGKTTDTMGPAGGTYTTSADTAKWLIVLLNDGRVGGKQLLPQRAVRAMQAEQTRQKAQWRYFQRWGWAIGQDLGDYEGDLFIHRFGGFNGAYSHVSFMPDRNLGVAVYSTGGSPVADALAAYAYDVMLGKKDLDAKWSKELANLVKAADENFAKVQKAAPERKTAARPLATYAGQYHYDRLGRLVVSVEGERLFAKLGVLNAELIPIGGDDFVTDWTIDVQTTPVRFVVDANGKVTRFEWGDRLFEWVK